MTQEQRFTPRLELNVPVELASEGFETIQVETEDLTDEGAFLRRPSPSHSLPTIGAEVFVTLTGPLAGANPKTHRATVVRDTDAGIGIQFE